MSGTGNSGRGILVMLDGPDGVGKTTQVELAAIALREKGYRVHTTRLSGGTPIGEALRKISLDPKLRRSPQTDLHIVLAMYYALASSLEQYLSKGEICIVDRSPLSIIAYQVFGSGLPIEVGRQATEMALELFSPKRLICYVAPNNVISEHRKARHQKHNNDYFEVQSEGYSDRVIEGFKQALKLFNVSIIDASQNKVIVHQETIKIFEEVI